VDGENVKSENWNVFSQIDLRFKPFVFYDVFSKETRSGSSYINVQGKGIFCENSFCCRGEMVCECVSGD
jgi:hypothetical protein